MKKISFKLLLCVLFSAIMSINNLSAENSKISDNGKLFVPGMFVVKFEDQKGNIESSAIFNTVIQQYQVERAEQLFPHQKYRSSPKRKIIDLSRIYQFQVPESSNIEKICADLNNKPGIAYAEPVYILKACAVPNDPSYSAQRHLPQIQAPEAWDVVKGDSSVIIAIVDTGVDWDHPDLAANIWINTDEVLDGTDTDGNGFVDDIRGWDWVEDADDPAPGEDWDVPDNNPMDFDGHGSHCAGIAAAVTNNGEGVAGVSWNCTIMALRIGWHGTDGLGHGYSSWMASAFIYAADNGAHVINLSYGNSQVVVDAARYAFEVGVVITTSAGNDGDEADYAEEGDPLSLVPFSLAVAAVDDRDYKATYSSYGNWVNVSAPGGDQSGGRPGILSTVFDDSYTYLQGTSQASPVVAGLAGLLKSQHPEWSSPDITFQIINTADNIDQLNPQFAGKLGSGRVNAYRAVTEPLIEPAPKIELVSQSVDDETGGNGNGIAEAGEELSLIVEFMNNMGNASNVTANLVIEDWAIEVLNGTSFLGEVTGIRDLENNRKDNSADPFIFQIDSSALPHRIKGVIEVIADGGYHKTFDFIFSISPSILLVDDEELDNEKYYVSALDSLNISYVYWDHNLNGTPSNMANYSTVIWACEWTFPSLNALDRTVIKQYLDSGGNLFLSGQDIGWDLCDLGSDINEYHDSNGASLTFYENYLHAQYLLDVSEFSTLTGVTGDPIGEGLSFDVYQPGRDAENQYPSEVIPINDGISIFNYANGNSGAVRYAGLYRTVYFAFGGYEAITDPDVQFTVMGRVLDWLNGLHVVHTPFQDTEDSVNDYLIQVNVTSQAQPIGKVELLWDTDNALPFINKISMTDMGDGLYQAAIPAQPTGTDIQYTIFTQTASGYYSPIIFYHFHVGSDNAPPIFDNVYKIPHSLSNKGPYNLSALITDNLGVDSNSVYMFYETEIGTMDSLKMHLTDGRNRYEASFKGNYSFGDTIKYYITAKDTAIIPNKAISDNFQFIIGLDDFENGIDQWQVEANGWGLESEEDPYSGQYYASDSPGQNYLPGANTSMQLKTILDLSESDSAEALYFWTKHKLQPGKAYGYVEVSIDSGITWTQLGESIKAIRNTWIEKEYSLTDYIGIDELLLRFRLEADSTAGTNYDGWFIDDIQVREKFETSAKSKNLANNIPTKFFLAQNFPNPFNPETNIAYQLSAAGEVTIKIYNTIGQFVGTLVHENKPVGNYSVLWNGKDNNGIDVSSGIYFYQMRIKDFIQTNKMLLLK